MSKNEYMDAKALDKEIPLIAAASKKLDERIQSAALACINHRLLHGDVVYINRLYLALGKGVRKSALTEWLLKYGGVVANEDPGSKKDKPFLFDKARKVDMDGGTKQPWYECKKDPTPDEVFDAGKAFGMFMRKLNEALDKGKPIEGMSASQIDRLKQVMGGNVAADVQEAGL